MKSSGVITLLTDFGVADPYVAMMKGVILSLNPEARLVDVTHEVRQGDILGAAMVIGETYRFFPPGTVHVGVVDPGVGTDRRGIAVEAGGHGFVGPDNGLFWPIIQGGNARVVHLTEKRFFLPSVSPTFHGRDIFAPVAAHLSLGVGLEQMGLTVADLKSIPLPAPRIEGDSLCGRVVHVDHFGNIVSNVESETLHRFLGSSEPSIHLGSLVIRGVDRTYSDVEEGQPLALINSSNLLEVAVNMGRAAEAVGVEKSDLIGAEIRVTRAGRFRNPARAPRKAASDTPPTPPGSGTSS